MYIPVVKNETVDCLSEVQGEAPETVSGSPVTVSRDMSLETTVFRSFNLAFGLLIFSVSQASGEPGGVW